MPSVFTIFATQGINVISMSLYGLFTRYKVLLVGALLLPFGAMAQGVWAVGAHIDEASPIDFVLGEYVVEYTAPATMGFLPSTTRE